MSRLSLPETGLTLKQARGKVIFLLDQQSNVPIYLQGHSSLRARVLFTNATPGRADAAFVEANNGSEAEIEALVRKGYLVRTRSDADTLEGRTNDTRRRDQVLASGAQMISTDYPGLSRPVGPATALPCPADCRSAAIRLWPHQPASVRSSKHPQPASVAMRSPVYRSTPEYIKQMKKRLAACRDFAEASWMGWPQSLLAGTFYLAVIVLQSSGLKIDSVKPRVFNRLRRDEDESLPSAVKAAVNFSRSMYGLKPVLLTLRLY